MCFGRTGPLLVVAVQSLNQTRTMVCLPSSIAAYLTPVRLDRPVDIAELTRGKLHTSLLWGGRPTPSVVSKHSLE